jgi:hypothetical protein
MIVVARPKRKHKQQINSNNGSETTSQRDQALVAQRTPASHIAKSPSGHHSNDVNLDDGEDNDRKPAARPLADVAQAVRQENRNNDQKVQEEEQAQGNASSSSSSSDQRAVPGSHAQHQPLHAYDSPRVVTESGSNNNTTSGSGSGGNSGSNHGSSGSGNGSSGNEGKNSSEEVGGKEETGVEGNSNSEDINSDDRKPEDEKEIAHRVSARRGQNAAVTVGDDDMDHTMKAQTTCEALAIPASVHNSNNEFARERKLLDKKRKRMSMRREYEEKVQQEAESSESSSTDAAVCLRPGKPVTLDKVLSFTKVARLVSFCHFPFF